MRHGLRSSAGEHGCRYRFCCGVCAQQDWHRCDAGKTDVSVSGSASSEGLQVEVKTTEDSSKEETQLKGEGVEKYLTAEAVDAAAKILALRRTP